MITTTLNAPFSLQKKNRDWDNFVIEDTFEDQEKVWVKYGKLGYWEARYYSHKKGKLHRLLCGSKKEYQQGKSQPDQMN